MACNIFTKDRKKVTFNREIYDCLAPQFKDLFDEQEKKRGNTTNIAGVKMVSSPPQNVTDAPDSQKEATKKADDASEDSEQSFDSDIEYRSQSLEILSQIDRINSKLGKVKELVD